MRPTVKEKNSTPLLTAYNAYDSAADTTHLANVPDELLRKIFLFLPIIHSYASINRVNKNFHTVLNSHQFVNIFNATFTSLLDAIYIAPLRKLLRHPLFLCRNRWRKPPFLHMKTVPDITITLTDPESDLSDETGDRREKEVERVVESFKYLLGETEKSTIQGEKKHMSLAQIEAQIKQGLQTLQIFMDEHTFPTIPDALFGIIFRFQMALIKQDDNVIPENLTSNTTDLEENLQMALLALRYGKTPESLAALNLPQVRRMESLFNTLYSNLKCLEISCLAMKRIYPAKSAKTDKNEREKMERHKLKTLKSLAKMTKGIGAVVYGNHLEFDMYRNHVEFEEHTKLCEVENIRKMFTLPEAERDLPIGGYQHNLGGLQKLHDWLSHTSPAVYNPRFPINRGNKLLTTVLCIIPIIALLIAAPVMIVLSFPGAKQYLPKLLFRSLISWCAFTFATGVPLLLSIICLSISSLPSIIKGFTARVWGNALASPAMSLMNTRFDGVGAFRLSCYEHALINNLCKFEKMREKDHNEPVFEGNYNDPDNSSDEDERVSLLQG